MICLYTIILQQLIANTQRTRGAKYSLPVPVTHLCRNFLSDEVFSRYDRVSVSPEFITIAYNSCFHSIWTPTVQLRMFLLRVPQRDKQRKRRILTFGDNPTH